MAASAQRKRLLSAVVGTDQDFEFYPTTDQIIAAINHDMASSFKRGNTFPMVSENGPSLLDIGAGDGETLLKLKASKRYAIEKSIPLLDAMPPNISVIGTNFDEQQLIDKEVDVIFCNPPYSEFESWASKIIREGHARLIYLVIPDRWEKSKEIVNALNDRLPKWSDPSSLPKFMLDRYEVRKKVSVLGAFDFLSGDRTARAKVELVRVELSRGAVDPFKLWFESTIEISRNADLSAPSFKSKDQLAENLKTELVKGRDLIEILEQTYQRDMQSLGDTYRQLENISRQLLEELGVKQSDVLSGLQSKIKGLKNLYWTALFENLTKITDRLTHASRKSVLDTLMRSTSVDFSASNAYPIVRWSILESNRFLDSQLITLFERMSNAASVIVYSSNAKTWGADAWRYGRQLPDDLDYYSLDYRFVLDRVGGLARGDHYDRERKGNLSDSAFILLNDIRTVASNLGFERIDTSSIRSTPWTSQNRAFQCKNLRTGDTELLFDVRVFENQNMHLRFSPKFMLALNAEFGRLKGWLKCKTQAAAELNSSLSDISECWNTNAKLGLPDPGVLLIEATAPSILGGLSQREN